MQQEPENESSAMAAQEITRVVSQPFPFYLIIALDDDGALYGLGQSVMPDMDATQRRQVQRATLYIGGLVQAAQLKGEGAREILEALPDHREFVVERAVLREVLAVQAIRSGRRGPRRMGLAQMRPEGRA